MDTRAHTRLDPGAATIANRWIARQWSHFSGHTVELRLPGEDFDWLSAKCPELGVKIAGAWLGLRALGAVEWAEERSGFGAALVARYTGGPLEVQVRTDAFHDSPGLLRRVTLLNTGPESVIIDAVILDALSLRRDGVTVHTEQFTCADLAREWQTSERAAAIMRKQHGLFLVLEGGGTFALFSPEADRCTVLHEEQRAIAPGQRWTLPDCALAPFSGPVEEAVSKVLGHLLQQVRNLKKWEVEQSVL